MGLKQPGRPRRLPLHSLHMLCHFTLADANRSPAAALSGVFDVSQNSCFGRLRVLDLHESVWLPYPTATPDARLIPSAFLCKSEQTLVKMVPPVYMQALVCMLSVTPLPVRRDSGQGHDERPCDCLRDRTCHGHS